ncbi:VOC family protein [Halalkalicoccus ordinarius]|uniref:VOC family protein n=1 Tax=Halalkalicoccus ordinarius TaxID=3116651 RepID=UPI00300E92DE
MEPTGIDHFVLTVSDVERACEFYERVLDCEVVTFGEGRRALRFGDQKVNLHPDGWDHEPKAERPTPGSGDFCVLTETPIEAVERELRDASVEIVEGPVERTGARGPIESVYFRDPDGNLVEVARYRE